MSFPNQRHTHEPINIPQISQSIVLGPLAQPNSIEIEEGTNENWNFNLLWDNIIILRLVVLVGAIPQSIHL